MELGPVKAARIWNQKDLEEPLRLPFAGGQVVAYTRRAPGKESVNEDTLAVLEVGPQAGLLVVADGAGGMPAGYEASRLAVETLLARVGVEEGSENLRPAIVDAIELANDAVRKMGTGSATTLAVVEVVGRSVRTYHVGDSPIMVFGQRGAQKLQIVPHSPVGYAVESGLLAEEEAVAHEDRYLVSNLLGTSEMRIELGPVVQLAERDTVVVSSDGLVDNYLVDEISDRIRTGPLLERAGALATECRERMQSPGQGHPSHADDLTFALFRLQPPPA